MEQVAPVVARLRQRLDLLAQPLELLLVGLGVLVVREHALVVLGRVLAAHQRAQRRLQVVVVLQHVPARLGRSPDGQQLLGVEPRRTVALLAAVLDQRHEHRLARLVHLAAGVLRGALLHPRLLEEQAEPLLAPLAVKLQRVRERRRRLAEVLLRRLAVVVHRQRAGEARAADVRKRREARLEPKVLDEIAQLDHVRRREHPRARAVVVAGDAVARRAGRLVRQQRRKGDQHGRTDGLVLGALHVGAGDARALVDVGHLERHGLARRGVGDLKLAQRVCVAARVARRLHAVRVEQPQLGDLVLEAHLLRMVLLLLLQAAVVARHVRDLAPAVVEEERREERGATRRGERAVARVPRDHVGVRVEGWRIRVGEVDVEGRGAVARRERLLAQLGPIRHEGVRLALVGLAGGWGRLEALAQRGPGRRRVAGVDAQPRPVVRVPRAVPLRE